MHARLMRLPFHGGASGLLMRPPPADSASCMCPVPRGFQRSEPCRGGFFSPACWLDAGSSLGQGWCSAHSRHPSIMRMRQRCPSVEYVNIRGSTSLVSASVFTAMSPPSFVRVNARGSASAFTAMPPLVCACQRSRVEIPRVRRRGSSISRASPRRDFESTLSIQPDL